MSAARSWQRYLAALFALMLIPGMAWGETTPSGATIALPGGEHGIGLDDMVYSPALRRFIIPGGRSGNIFLVAPHSGQVTVIHHVSEKKGEGITSATDALGYIFAGDRSANEIAIVDPRTTRVVARQKLASKPDYVRYVNALRELWVTEPDAEQIQIFQVHTDDTPHLEPGDRIPIPGGPESLVIDDRSRVAYTNLWSDRTLAIGLVGHRVVSRWPNTCTASRGLAFAPRMGLLFVGCKEGKAVSMDPADNGTILSTAATGKGVDIIAYDDSTNRLYVPGGPDGTLTVLSVAPSGRLKARASLPTATDAHCAVSDGHGTVYVCDPRHGRLLVVAPQQRLNP
jgi:DNA-binding beta-propeller fold protein YncE